MCLAEAMLRVPDSETVDDLIRDKITPHDWGSHIGDSGSDPGERLDLGTDAHGPGARRRGTTGGSLGTLHWSFSIQGALGEAGDPAGRSAGAMAKWATSVVLGRTIKEAMKRGQGMRGEGHIPIPSTLLGEAARNHCRCRPLLSVLCERHRGDREASTKGDIPRRTPAFSVESCRRWCTRATNLAARELWCPRWRAGFSSLARGREGTARGSSQTSDAREGDRLTLSSRVYKQCAGRPLACRLGRVRGGRAGLRAQGAAGDRLA